MVKNTKGGKGSKSIARKSVAVNTSKYLRIPENELETFAVVTKFYGNICDVLTNDNKSYRCHIRGKFKGKFKRNSFISVGKIILIGFRHFEEPNYINTDLLYVYDLNEYSQFSYLPGYDISNLITFHNNLSFSKGTLDNEIIFEEQQQQQSIIEEKEDDQIQPTSDHLTIDDNIDINDI
jgi:translation initiation factor IF-1